MFERDTGCPGPQSNGYPREPVKWDRLHPRVRPGPPVGQPASSTKPKHPDPQSQSLSRSYGSNLPTSLTYIILSTRGYSPRRPAADMGTSLCDSAVTLSLIFKVPPVTHGHSENCCALCLDQNPFSPRRNSRASAAYAEKTTLPRARVDVSGSFHVAMSVRGPNGSAIRLRNKDLIPFRPKLWSSQTENTTQFYRVSPKP